MKCISYESGINILAGKALIIRFSTFSVFSVIMFIAPLTYLILTWELGWN